MMNGAQWDSCYDPSAMVKYLTGTVNVASNRKLRLFTCGCARQVWHMLRQKTRKYVDIGEYVADNINPRGYFARAGAFRSARNLLDEYQLMVALTCLDDNARKSARQAAVPGENYEGATAQCNLLRDIFGHLFNNGPNVKQWVDAEVSAIATDAYENRTDKGLIDTGTLSILADSLEDKGCTYATLIFHLRGMVRHHGPVSAEERKQFVLYDNWYYKKSLMQHMRGCWALDMVLGKS